MATAKISQPFFVSRPTPQQAYTSAYARLLALNMTDKVLSVEFKKAVTRNESSFCG